MSELIVDHNLTCRRYQDFVARSDWTNHSYSLYSPINILSLAMLLISSSSSFINNSKTLSLTFLFLTIDPRTSASLSSTNPKT